MDPSISKAQDQVQCEECGKWMSKKAINKHKLMHTGIVKCKVCHLFLANEVSLLNHNTGWCPGAPPELDNPKLDKTNDEGNVLVPTTYLTDVLSHTEIKEVGETSPVLLAFGDLYDVTGGGFRDYGGYLIKTHATFRVPEVVLEYVRLCDVLGPGDTFQVEAAGSSFRRVWSIPEDKQACRTDYMKTPYDMTHYAVYRHHRKCLRDFVNTYAFPNCGPFLAKVNQCILHSIERQIFKIICDHNGGLVISASIFAKSDETQEFLKDGRVGIPKAMAKFVFYRHPIEGVKVKSWNILNVHSKDNKPTIQSCEMDSQQLALQAGLTINFEAMKGSILPTNHAFWEMTYSTNKYGRSHFSTAALPTSQAAKQGSSSAKTKPESTKRKLNRDDDDDFKNPRRTITLD